MADGQHDDARRRMLEIDLRGRGISDPAVLAAMEQVDRARFVDDHRAGQAYDDRPLPIGDDQTISQPYIVAFMAEQLRLGPHDRVLDVGTGSGYAAAIMASVAGEVWSIERIPALADQAATRLTRLGHENVHVVVGDGTLGWPDAAPYDAISVAAGSPEIPPALTDQLAEGGRLIIPVDGRRSAQTLVLVERHGDELVRRDVLDVRFVPLIRDSP
jgi:protein-L-isoaspartate(D-aspartate) O-methyltransferase